MTGFFESEKCKLLIVVCVYWGLPQSVACTRCYISLKLERLGYDKKDDERQKSSKGRKGFKRVRIGSDRFGRGELTYTLLQYSTI